MSTGHQLSTFSEQDIASLRPEMKVGLLATINHEGLPHITLLSSLQAVSPTRLTFGQFIEGLSKSFVRENPRTGFLVMTLQREVWRGKARFSHTAQRGPEFDDYNRVPMFRYNAYLGIHTVYYLDLVEQGGREGLPMGSIVSAALATSAARLFSRHAGGENALNPWTRRLFNGMGNPKFISWLGTDGYPRIVPVFQAQAAAAGRIIFSIRAYGDELEAIPRGAPVAAFGMTLSMEDVLARGTFRGIRRIGPSRCGILDVDWVYNPMPPLPGPHPSTDRALGGPRFRGAARRPGAAPGWAIAARGPSLRLVQRQVAKLDEPVPVGPAARQRHLFLGPGRSEQRDPGAQEHRDD